MLISYPFLHRQPLEDDGAETGHDLRRLGELAGSGIFPVSQTFGWHGGSHWQAPVMPSGSAEPVRAIADGVVVYARNSDQRPTNAEALKQHPLHYYKGWTSNGVVILKHTTEIGENVKVTFYSIYQHIDKLSKHGPANQKQALKPGDNVYRKDALGTAGFIYNQPNRIHLEIVAARDQLTALMGRSGGELTSPEGRRDCVWGNTHIVVPAGVPIYERDPARATVDYPLSHGDRADDICTLFHTSLAYLRKMTPAVPSLDKSSDDDRAWFDKRSGLTQRINGTNAPTHTESMIQVPLLYGAAVDPSPSQGQPSQQRTRLPGQYFAKEIGRTTGERYVCLSESGGTVSVSMRTSSDSSPHPGEQTSAHDLYSRSTQTYPGCASAGYDMLHFGRVLGPDQPAPLDLHMGRLPHFRKLSFPTAQGDSIGGYIDLNTREVRVYSDADFPPWEGWTFIDDDANATADSRCRSARLLDLLDPPPAQVPQPSGDAPTLEQVQQRRAERLARASAALGGADVRKRLRNCIVTMHTEWSSDSFDQQWEWLKGTKPNDPRAMRAGACLSEEAYTRFRRHYTALAFWEQAQAEGLELDKVHVHFHPGAFIDAFRQCTWLSLREQTQLLPRDSGITAGGPNLAWSVSRNRFLRGNTDGSATSPPDIGLALNHMFRKYGFTTALRQAHFLGQCFKETGAMKWAAELGGPDYFRKMYEIYTPEEAAYDFDHRHQWLTQLGFLKGRDRPTYIAQRPGEVREKALKGGNTQQGDGARFRGRGLIHLTWRNGYRDYGVYRNRDFTTDPNPERVQSDAETAADSAGYFWTMRRIHRAADGGATNDDVRKCFRLVGGADGLQDRQQFFRYAYFILNDAPDMPVENGLSRQLEDQS